MKKWRIALLHYTCPPIVGGVEEVIRHQALVFDAMGHETIIIAGQGLQSANVVPVVINPFFSSQNRSVDKAVKAFTEGTYGPFQFLVDTFYEDLKDTVGGCDFLIVHNVMTMPYNLPLTYALERLSTERFVKVISWNHDSVYFYPDYPEEYDEVPWTILKEKIPSISYACISHARAVEFAELYGTKKGMTVIPNGIDVSRFFQFTEESQLINEERKLSEADLIMVHPARLVPRKNFELGIRVAGALKRRGYDVRYLITGAYNPHEQKNREYYKRLRQLARDEDVGRETIFIAEYQKKDGTKIVPRQRLIRDLYFIADFLFMPSFSEGFGIPLMEAGLCKLPIVCSQIAPFTEIGGDHVYRFPLDAEPDEIATGICDFLSHCSSHRMYRHIIRHYVWSAVYHQHIKPFLASVDRSAAR